MIKLYALIYGNENFHSDFWTCIHDFLFFFANGLCLKIDLTSQIELLSCPCIHLPVISNIDTHFWDFNFFRKNNKGCRLQIYYQGVH